MNDVVTVAVHQAQVVEGVVGGAHVEENDDVSRLVRGYRREV